MKYEVIKSRFYSTPPSRGWIAVDTETTGLNLWCEDRVFAVGICDDTEDGNLRYWEWPVDPLTRQPSPDPDDLAELRQILEDPTTAKVFHNAKFDLLGLQLLGIKVRGRVEDTSFAARICDTQEISYGLKPLARKYFDFPNDDEGELRALVSKLRAKAKAKGWNIHEELEADYWLVAHAEALGFDLEDTGQCARYCQGDVIRTSLLWRMYGSIFKEDHLYAKTYERELQLMPDVMAMERRGMGISPERNERELKLATKMRDQYLGELMELAKGCRFFSSGKKPRQVPFNPASTQHLAHILYGQEKGCYKLEVKRETKKGGAPSTDKKALRDYASHPFVHLLTQYRGAERAISMYFGKYKEWMRPETLNPGSGEFVLHCNLNQCGTVTGRFSCDTPNLQQVANPDTSAYGSNTIQVRVPFGPRKGYYWWSVDYSQMELRVLADVAEVDELVIALQEGKDLNTLMANKAWGGKNNPRALWAAAFALDFDKPEPSNPLIAQVWEELEWDPSKAKYGLKSSMAMDAADRYLAKHDYLIVEAEAAVKKKITRTKHKTITFCKGYGGGWKAAMELLFCTEEEARDMWIQYDRAYPELADFIKSFSAGAASRGYVITRYGRKLRVDPDFSYRAVNYMVQGSCADLMKDAILKVAKLYRELQPMDVNLLMTIHDELLSENAIGLEEKYPWVLEEKCRLMADHGGRFKVDMPVEMKCIYKQWDEKK